jgi:hypothetical protein
LQVAAQALHVSAHFLQQSLAEAAHLVEHSKHIFSQAAQTSAASFEFIS